MKQQTSQIPQTNFRKIEGIDFVRISAGKFLMGSRDDNKSAYDSEKPQHIVKIPYDYWIGRFPITNEQYELFVLATDHHHEKAENWAFKFNHPVVGVSWNDAQVYCSWLNESFGNELLSRYTFRLPTEAEWEKAARGGFGFEWPWGNKFDASKCNSSEGGKGDTTPVGLYSPQGDSSYGCSDTVGNTWEWTQSLFKKYSYQAGDGREDLQSAGERVMRGGSFEFGAHFARCAFRFGYDPDFRYWASGFRVVVSPLLS